MHTVRGFAKAAITVSQQASGGAETRNMAASPGGREEPGRTTEVEQATPEEARLLCSFVPALMLKTMQIDKAAIEPPTTHNCEAVALFAVRNPLSIFPTVLSAASRT